MRSRWQCWLLLLLAAVTCGPARGDGAFFSSRPVMSEPDQKALLIWHDGRETLFLQVNYRNAPPEFGWVVPVPSRPKLDVAPKGLFPGLDSLTRPRLFRPPSGPRKQAAEGARSMGVTVEERAVVGPYDATVLAADDADALGQWLRQHHFRMPLGAEQVLEPYVGARWHYVAYRISAARSQQRLLTQLRRVSPDVTSLTGAPERIARRIVDAVDRRDARAMQMALDTDGTAQSIPGAVGPLRMANVASAASKAIDVRTHVPAEAGSPPGELDVARRDLYRMAHDTVEAAVAAVAEGAPAGRIMPLTLEFDCPEPIYPLRISALNSGVTEVDLYVLGAHRVQVAGEEYNRYTRLFRTRFARRLDLAETNTPYLADLRRLLRPEARYLTALHATLTPHPMASVGDLRLMDAPNDRSFVETVDEEGRRVVWVASRPRDVGLVLLGMALMLGGGALCRRWRALRTAGR